MFTSRPGKCLPTWEASPLCFFNLLIEAAWVVEAICLIRALVVNAWHQTISQPYSIFKNCFPWKSCSGGGWVGVLLVIVVLHWVAVFLYLWSSSFLKLLLLLVTEGVGSKTGTWLHRAAYSLCVRILWGKTDLSRVCIPCVENSLPADCPDAWSEVVFLQTLYSLDCWSFALCEVWGVKPKFALGCHLFEYVLDLRFAPLGQWLSIEGRSWQKVSILNFFLNRKASRSRNQLVIQGRFQLLKTQVLSGGLLAAVWSHQYSLSPRPCGLCTSFILRFWRLTHVPAVIWPTLAPSAGAAGPRLFTIHQIDACTNNLPKAHTWWVTSVAFFPHARYIGVSFKQIWHFICSFYWLDP